MHPIAGMVSALAPTLYQYRCQHGISTEITHNYGTIAGGVLISLEMVYEECAHFQFIPLESYKFFTIVMLFT